MEEILGEVAEHGLKRITANDSAGETWPLGSNPSLSAIDTSSNHRDLFPGSFGSIANGSAK